MFTLSPYNDFELEHVAEICGQYNVFLRVGIYNNIPFFDTIENARKVFFVESKNKELLNFSKVKQLQEEKKSHGEQSEIEIDLKAIRNDHYQIPSLIREFPENYDYISLYPNWLEGNLRLTCNSILDSLIVLPDGSVPICQNLNLKLGNVNEKSLDEIFNSEATVQTQTHYSVNAPVLDKLPQKIRHRTVQELKIFRQKSHFQITGYYKWDAKQNGYDPAVG
jgi:MoaA/NifB/PqqE/SkfB family radical SAM enzyme